MYFTVIVIDYFCNLYFFINLVNIIQEPSLAL